MRVTIAATSPTASLRGKRLFLAAYDNFTSLI